MIGALLCAALAARGAALVPARAEAVLVLDGEAGISGLRDLLDAAGTKSRAVSPRELSREIAALFGADLLSRAPGWGLDPRGTRALIVAGEAFGLVAPVRDRRAARKALLAWVGAAGAWGRRVGARGPITAGSGRSQRAGLIAAQRGSLRLFTASGPGAAALVSAASRIGARRRPTRTLAHDERLAALLPAGNGRAALIVRGEQPVSYTVLDLQGSASGLVARGLVGASSPLLAGHAPDAAACADSSLFCLRASLGDSGRTVLAFAAHTYLMWTAPAGPLADRVLREAPRTELFVAKSDGIDVSLLGDPSSSLWALRLVAVAAPSGEQTATDGTPDSAQRPPAGDLPADLSSDGPRGRCLHAEALSTQLATPCIEGKVELHEGDGPALQATLDPAALDSALSRLGPFDALRGAVAATAVAARLLVGGLLRGSAPVTLMGDPDPLGARIELRWSLR